MSQPAITSGRRAVITTFCVVAGTMQALDGTIANIALPHMQGTMNASQDQIAWVLTSYMVASAIGLTLTTPMVERFGRTRVLVVAISAFTIASVMCGMAQSLFEIVIFRVMQGFLGGTLVPLSQSVLIDIYPRERRTFAMSVWGMGALVGPMLGPTLGGYLTDILDWRWVFFINAPIGALAAAGLALTLPETPHSRGRHFDGIGFGFLTLAICALQVMLDRGEMLDWFSSQEIDVEAIVAAASFYLFAVHMITAERPFINRALLRDRNYVLSQLVCSVVGATLYVFSAIVPLMMQSLMNYPPTTAGFILSTRALGSIVGMYAVNVFSRRSPRGILLFGILVSAIGEWQMIGFTVNIEPWAIELSGALYGLGTAIVWSLTNVMCFATIDAKLTTEASVVGSLIRNTIGSASISSMVALIANNSQVNHQILTEHITAFSRSLQNLAAHTMITLNSQLGLAILNGEVDREAAMGAYVDDFVILAWLTVACVPFVFLLHGRGQAPVASEAVAQEL